MANQKSEQHSKAGIQFYFLAIVVIVSNQTTLLKRTNTLILKDKISMNETPKLIDRIHIDTSTPGSMALITGYEMIHLFRILNHEFNSFDQTKIYQAITEQLIDINMASVPKLFFDNLYD
ncbi:hypothetical protein DERF_002915 [Dermatophagoides farinae]|uniref:Uncharacterized protein n=1 Tax=Dermatophagoides farinae TaxID=6954 RepID=A0A922IE31_DERFA|nr:hypothetical protein DERF_002915 [Dermatophagoides farinae]